MCLPVSVFQRAHFSSYLMLQNRSLKLSGLKQRKPFITPHSFCWQEPRAAQLGGSGPGFHVSLRSYLSWGSNGAWETDAHTWCWLLAGGELMLAVGWGPQLLPTWAFLPVRCLSALLAWQLASPRASDSADQGRSCTVFCDLALAVTHCYFHCI